MDISFIIPIYNTPSDKLSRCFDSFLKITNMSYEVILVDDGSEEATGNFCKEYAAEHERFRYFYKENAGVSAARNYGIDVATADYIAFVDSDDIIVGESYTLEDIGQNSDFVIYNMQYTGELGKGIYPFNERESCAITGSEIMCALFRDSSIGGPCAKLYRRDILNEHNIRFDVTMKVAEDADFVCRYLYLCNSMRYVNKVVYLYDFSPNSGNNRIINFPDITLNNYSQIFKRYLQALSIFDFTPEESTTSKNYIGNRTINILFEVAGILMENKALSNERKRNICSLADEAYAITSCRSGIKNKVYCFLLLHRCWIVSALLSKMRSFYQRFFLKY